MSENEEQRGPAEIERDIEQTRDQLGDTAEALAAKADVKARAQERVEEAKGTVRDKRDELLGKAKAATSGSADGGGGGASAGAQQVKAKAQENPVHTGVAGGFVAGLLVGRILFGGRG